MLRAGWPLRVFPLILGCCFLSPSLPGSGSATVGSGQRWRGQVGPRHAGSQGGQGGSQRCRKASGTHTGTPHLEAPPWGRAVLTPAPQSPQPAWAAPPLLIPWGVPAGPQGRLSTSPTRHQLPPVPVPTISAHAGQRGPSPTLLLGPTFSPPSREGIAASWMRFGPERCWSTSPSPRCLALLSLSRGGFSAKQPRCSRHQQSHGSRDMRPHPALPLPSLQHRSELLQPPPCPIHPPALLIHPPALPIRPPNPKDGEGVTSLPHASVSPSVQQGRVGWW